MAHTFNLTKVADRAPRARDQYGVPGKFQNNQGYEARLYLKTRNKLYVSLNLGQW